VGWCPDGDLLAIFLRPVFSASRAQHVSDLHSRFALCGSMVDIQSPTAEIRRGKKEEERKKKTGQKYNGLPYYIGRP